jgi:lysophospholipase L1-like esterase
MPRFLLILACLIALAARLHANPSLSFAEFDRKARAGERQSVVFFGGSLTWGANASDPQRTSWRAKMCDHLLSTYPRGNFVFHDAAIGGTGSKLGLFRLGTDVFGHKPDLVFLEFTMNDGAETADAEGLAAYEGLMRRLIEKDVAVLQVFTCFKYHMKAGFDARTLPRYVAHQKLAAAYHTGVGDGLSRMQEMFNAGTLDVGEIWPFDGAHPGDAGYHIFYEAIRAGFDQAVAEKRLCILPPEPVFGDDYRHTQRRGLWEDVLPSGWSAQPTYRTSMWFDGLSSRWIRKVVAFQSKDGVPPTVLKSEFTGSYVGIFGEKNGTGLSFKARIDGQLVFYKKDPKTEPSEIWPNDTKRMGGGNLFSWIELADHLAPGQHVLEIEPVLDPEKPEGQLRIESVCSAWK